MQARKWFKWGKDSASDGEYEEPEAIPSQVFFKNPETPESPAAFLQGLDPDRIREQAKKLSMRSDEGSLEELMADRLLLALDAFDEVRERAEELSDRIISEHHVAQSAVQRAHRERDDFIRQAQHDKVETVSQLNAAKQYARVWKKAARRLRLIKNTVDIAFKRANKERWEYRNALVQVSTGVCTRSKMFTGACPSAFPDTPTSWCGACLAREVVAQFEE